MKEKKLNVVILAAGKGTRMKSDLPKVLHKLCGKPLLGYVLDAVGSLGSEDPYIIVGYRANTVENEFRDRNVCFVLQKEQLGTGHALMQTEPFLGGSDSTLLVLNGDMPFITTGMLNKLIDHHNKSKSSGTVLSAIAEDPEGYGRIIRDPHGDLDRIVEQKDGSLGELKIKEINTGTYCFDCRDVFAALREVRSENAQHEYYLTDVIKILRSKWKKASAFCADDPVCAIGINSKEQLDEAEKLMLSRNEQKQ